MTNFTLKWYFTPKFSVRIAKNLVKCTILGKKKDLIIMDFALNMINYNKILAKIAKNTAKYTLFSSKT